MPLFISQSMSMKVPTIVQEAQQALQAGYCVVIGLQSTGEVCFICLILSIPYQKNNQDSVLLLLNVQVVIFLKISFIFPDIAFSKPKLL